MEARLSLKRRRRNAVILVGLDLDVKKTEIVSGLSDMKGLMIMTVWVGVRSWEGG